MGATAACCVKRDDDTAKGLERRISWQNVHDPNDFLTFFDCIEGEEDAAPFRRVGSFEVVVLRKPAWQALNGKGESSLCPQRLDAVPESPLSPPADDPVDEDAVGRVASKARDLWLDRSSAGELDEELSERLRQGFPELEEWTAPATVRRMIRAACGNEAEAVEILDKAINCRVRRRTLFQTMRCPVTCDMRVIGMDLERRPVIYMNSSSQTASLGDMLPQIFLSFEAAVRIGHPEGQVLLIADMTGLKVRLNMDRAAMREFSNSFGTVFADRLKFILLVDFSYVAQTLWSLCQPFLSQRTRSKIQFVSEEEARNVCRERLSKGTCERVLSAFDVYRDTMSTPAEREAHARRTSICDVPLGIPGVNEAG